MSHTSLQEVLQSVHLVIASKYRACLSGLARRFDVDDLYQMVCMKAHVNQHQCRDDSIEVLRAWVLTIAHRELATAFEREVGTAKRSLRLESDVASIQIAAKGDDALGSLIHAEQTALELQMVNQHLNALPPRQSQAVRLRYLEELEYREIADRMGVTLQAVRSLVSKGLASIREAAC